MTGNDDWGKKATEGSINVQSEESFTICSFLQIKSRMRTGHILRVGEERHKVNGRR
jgi:hypothetical protein